MTMAASAVEEEACGASTVLELAGQDRAGLLADVTDMLLKNGCVVWSAAVCSLLQRCLQLTARRPIWV